MNFHDTIIIDKQNIMRTIKKEKPDVIGVTSSTSTFRTANDIAGQIKSEHDIPIMIGGVHISSMPHHLLDSNFDIGVVGEGEQTTLELMKTFEKFGGFLKKELKKIDGIIFKDKKLKTTRPRKLIEPLDEIPYPARDLLEMKKHYLLPRGSFFPGELVAVTGILTSRGCPYNCTFCSSSMFWRRIRFHSPEYVVGEITKLIEDYGVDHLTIWDDLFTANKRRLGKIVNLIEKEKINKQVEFIMNGRANLIDEETCKLLKRMNITRMSLGLESGSEKILKYLKGGTVTVKDNKRAIRLCKKFGIRTNGFFIIGSPMETEQDLKKTLDLVRDKNMDSFSVFQLAPFPGTGVWNHAKKKGLVNDSINFDYSKLSIPEFKEDFIMTEKISKEKFKEWYSLFQEEASKKHYKKIKLKPKHLKYILSTQFLKRALTHPKEILNYFKLSK